ncbi:MAG: hypothetical protein KBD27_03060 [Candidatus Moranbacteria bacterium]|nr:hypothetical protein [Candidatus Moranbacteria bacterium]
MKSRIWLLCGALALTAGLSGCGATLGGLVDTSKRWTAKLTGADDPNNTGALATMGRMQNAGTDAVAGAVGIKTEPVATTPEAMPPKK